jgi:arylsulfatase A-like enzyme
MSESGPPTGPEDDRPVRWSSLAILVISACMAGFVLLWFLANFTGQISHRSELRRNARAARTAAKAVEEAEATADPFVIFGPMIERPDAPKGARNLVLVVMTGLRQDHVTPYGAPADYTPRLQALASRGVRFADPISASPFTRTAAVAWLTGEHALALDMVEPGPRQNALALPESVVTFPERLQAAGWVTLGVTANPNLNTETGLSQGFDRFRDTEPDGLDPRHRLPGADAVAKAIELLDHRTDAEWTRPFYLQLALLETHHPYAPDPDSPSPYVGAVRRTDRLIGELLDALADRSYTMVTNTMVVVMSVHGAGLEQPPHHGKWHGRLLYPTSVQVPLLVAGPDVEGGRTVSGLVSHTDVPPTLLDLLGLEPPSGIDGRSWADAARGRTDRTERTRAISDTWYVTANRASIWTATRQCQKDFGSTRLEHDSFEDGCYDRIADPEFRSVFSDDALLAELVSWRETTPPAPDAGTAE